VGFAPVFIPVTLFLALAFVAFALLQQKTRREAQRLEVHNKLLERIGSAKEFGEFLSTDAGNRFLTAISPERPKPPHERVLTAVRTGTVLLFVGLALFMGIGERAFGTGSDELAIVPTLATGTGVGLLVAALLSYKLAKRFAALEPGSAATPEPWQSPR
jgi:hypothetical protein